MYQLHPKLAADTFKLGQFPLCDVLLMDDSQYPWLVLVPRREDIKEFYELALDDQTQLQLESTSLAELLMQHFNGDKYNYAALGNVVPQLHLHHIVRFTTDAAWPAPIWGVQPMLAYSEPQRESMISELRQLLSTKLSFFIEC